MSINTSPSLRAHLGHKRYNLFEAVPVAGFGGIIPQANSVPGIDAPRAVPRAIMSHKFHVTQVFKGNHLPAFELFEHCGSLLYD